MALISYWRLSQAGDRLDTVGDNDLANATVNPVGSTGVGVPGGFTAATTFSQSPASGLATQTNWPANLRVAGLTNWTLLGWITHNGGAPSTEQHLYGANDGNNGWLVFFPVGSNALSFFIDAANTTYNGPTVATGGWHMFVVKKVGSTLKVKLDQGAYQVLTTNCPAITDLTTSPLYIGAVNAASINGQMAAVGFWNEDLSEAEITRAWGDGNGQYMDVDSPVSTELSRIDTWLYERLSGDATLTGLVGSRIYADVAPEGATFPYIVFSFQGGSDVAGVGTARLMTQAVYQVKAVRQGPSYAPLEDIAARLDVLLQGASGVAASGEVLACVREQPLRYAETDEGQHYRHLGGLYRIWAQS